MQFIINITHFYSNKMHEANQILVFLFHNNSISIQRLLTFAILFVEMSFATKTNADDIDCSLEKFMENVTYL